MGKSMADRLEEALRPFVESYKQNADPVGDSDLDNEQPRDVWVTLGDCRRARSVLQELENNRRLLLSDLSPEQKAQGLRFAAKRFGFGETE